MSFPARYVAATTATVATMVRSGMCRTSAARHRRERGGSAVGSGGVGAGVVASGRGVCFYTRPACQLLAPCLRQVGADQSRGERAAQYLAVRRRRLREALPAVLGQLHVDAAPVEVAGAARY